MDGAYYKQLLQRIKLTKSNFVPMQHVGGGFVVSDDVANINLVKTNTKAMYRHRSHIRIHSTSIGKNLNIVPHSLNSPTDCPAEGTTRATRRTTDSTAAASIPSTTHLLYRKATAQTILGFIIFIEYYAFLR